MAIGHFRGNPKPYSREDDRTHAVLTSLATLYGDLNSLRDVMPEICASMELAIDDLTESIKHVDHASLVEESIETNERYKIGYMCRDSRVILRGTRQVLRAMREMILTLETYVDASVELSPGTFSRHLAEAIACLQDMMDIVHIEDPELEHSNLTRRTVLPQENPMESVALGTDEALLE